MASVLQRFPGASTAALACLLAAPACTPFRTGAPAALDGATDSSDGATDVLDGATDVSDGSTDVSDGATDVSDGAGTDGGPSFQPPRPLSPLSTARVTSRRPVLRWAQGSASEVRAEVEICPDRACAAPEHTLTAASGTAGGQVTPPADLAPGVHYWRLFAVVGERRGARASPAWQFTVGAATAPTDVSWGTTLDLDGDGLRDVAVGAPDDAGGAGAVYVHHGRATLRPSADRTLAGSGVPAFGYVVVSAGDVNGDGFADLAVTAGRAPGGGPVFVFHGGPREGAATTPAVTLAVPAPGSFGVSVAALGDVDGDGYADLAVGQPAGGAGEAGRVHVYRGARDGLRATPATTLEGPDAPFAHFGQSVAAAGDVDADGYADLVVGAPGSATVPGAAYVYRGGPGGVGRAPAVTLSFAGAAASGFGFAVAGAADFDGDGYADVVASAPGPTAGRGVVRVYRGSVRGTTTDAPWELVAPDTPAGYFGLAVAPLDDADGDGLPELAVSASGAGAAGRVYVYRGARGAGLADDRRAALDAPEAGGFGYGLAGGGDVDGDHLGDLLVGAPLAAARVGRVFVYRGATGGLATTPWTTLRPFEGGEFGRAVAWRWRPGPRPHPGPRPQGWGRGAFFNEDFNRLL